MFKALASNSLDDDFPCDMKTSEGSSVDEVSRVVASSRIDREQVEHFVVADIHMWAEKVQEHMPGAKKPLLVNAGEEASKVLVVKLEISVFRSLT